MQAGVNLGGPKGGKTVSKKAATCHQLSTEGMKVWYTNPDQLRNKVDETKDRLKIDQPDVILINEVKPKAIAEYSLEDFDIDPNKQYEPLPNNIENNIGRGQLILVKKNLKHRQVYMETKFSECMFVEFDLKSKDKLLIALIYRSESEGEEMSKKLVELINELCNRSYTHLLITGDFNYKNINWEEITSKDKIETRFLNCVMDNYLHQHITEPTRWRGDDRPSLLDLILTNEENMITNLEIQAPVGLSDHAVISFTYRCYAEVNVEKYVKKKYHQAHYKSMKEHLKTVSWEKLKTTDDMDEAAREFLKVYEYMEEKFVPTVTKRADIKDKMPLEKSTLALIKEKTAKSRKVMKLKKKNASEEQLAEAKREYNRARNKVRRDTRIRRKNYEKNIAATAKKNPKPVYAYMNRKSKTKSGIADICIDPHNSKSTKTSCNNKKAKIFSEYFSSIWTEEPGGPLPDFEKRKVKYPMNPVSITVEIVHKRLVSLLVDKTPGPDGVHPMMLKMLADELAEPITVLFRKSIDHRKLALCWKTSNISVIFKKGLKCLAGNYRPISLTSILCKILESIIREQLVDHMIKNALFSDRQYGFISGRSAVLQLLLALDEWTEALDKGEDTDVIYLDYQKAFDTVPHRRLMKKVQAYGFTENIEEWLSDFLTGRSQIVNIKGEHSEAKNIKSGIPQGSVLGPFLFVLFVNDLPEIIRSMLFLFADDSKISRAISENNDKIILQNDLDVIVKWSDTWLMRIHPDKSAHVRIGKQMEVPQYEYMVGVRHVNYSTQEKDLGVVIDYELKFDAHIHEKVKKQT